MLLIVVGDTPLIAATVCGIAVKFVVAIKKVRHRCPLIKSPIALLNFLPPEILSIQIFPSS